MPATNIAAATHYFRRGVSRCYFCPSIANKSAPTRGELNAGTDLSNEVAENSGWEVKANTMDAPTLGSRFNAKSDGTTEADDSTITMYADAASVDARSLMPRGTNGFIVWLDEGDVAGRKMDVFPIRVTGMPKQREMEALGKLMFQYAVTSEPAENVTIPA